MPSEMRRQSPWTSDIALLSYFAMATVIVHVLAGGRYGFHRDELASLEDARHLAWGYVWQPPVTPLFARLSLQLFGASLRGFRLFAALPVAMALMLTGLMARELGGGRGAQLISVVAALPIALVFGARLQYSAFDYLCWTLTSYCVLRLLKSNDPRWWVAIGGSIGLGMMSKYTIIFYIAGVVAGVLATDARRYLRSKWLWYGAGLSVLIVLPNLLWQVRHAFITLDFAKYIHGRDIRLGRTQGFVFDQFTQSLLAFPLWMTGLYYYLISKSGRRFRALGWMYAVPFVLLVLWRGRGYYLVPAYPVLYAAGSVRFEQWVGAMRRKWTHSLRALAWALLVADALVAGSMVVPIAPPDSTWGRMAIRRNADFQEEIGWPELVATVANIRDSLPAENRAQVGILAGNYGEAGAINLYGPHYGLPEAISGMNSFWLRGYGNPPPQILIVVGLSREVAIRNFALCALMGHTGNRYGVENEEVRSHPEIFVCGGPLQGWPEFWRTFQYFG